MSNIHIIISGRVQGVGFRRYVFQEARQLHLKGWVRNLFDGRVEVLVELDQQNKALFIATLKKGPMFSHVSDIETHELSDEIRLSDFEIKEDGREPYGK